MKGTSAVQPLLIEQAQQRQTMALKNVRYRLTAEIHPFPGHEPKQQSLEAQFIRRAMQGKCFYQPCFGCREFPAYYRYVDSLDGEPSPFDYAQELGMMLYDVFDLRIPNDAFARPFISVFHADIRRGILNVPHYDSDEVLKPDAPERRVS